VKDEIVAVVQRMRRERSRGARLRARHESQSKRSCVQCGDGGEGAVEVVFNS
jgi:hypothetical protein